MKLVKVAAATLNQTPLDWDRNASHIRSALAEAKSRQVSILCLPELCITGYGCEDAFLAPAVRASALTLLEELLPETQGLIVNFGLPILHNNAVYNGSCLVNSGRILGFVA